MKTFISAVFATLLAINLAGCNTWHRADTGMVAGGVLGGVAGSALTGGDTLGTVGGAVVGGYAGRQLAK